MLALPLLVAPSQAYYQNKNLADTFCLPQSEKSQFSESTILYSIFEPLIESMIHKQSVRPISRTDHEYRGMTSSQENMHPSISSSTLKVRGR